MQFHSKYINRKHCYKIGKIYDYHELKKFTVLYNDELMVVLLHCVEEELSMDGRLLRGTKDCLKTRRSF